MDTIFLYNQQKESFPTEVIRYFTINDKKYFIFTLNEKDENGYVQLYVSRIENEYGQLVMKNITDENEWSLFKSTIQTIVTNNRSGIPNTTDLDYKELDNMVVTEFRIFKLKESVAKELGENKNAQILEKEPQTLEAASAQSNNLTIEQILKEVSEGARNAKEATAVKIDTKPVVEEKEETPTPVQLETPIPNVDEVDYKKKYEDLLKTTKDLEAENIRLINNLIEAKAKIETIRDIITD